MLTRDAIHSDADVLLYVEQAIGRAYRHVGQRRTDRADVARILSEHGAHSSAVQIAVEQYIRARLGVPSYDAAGAHTAQRQLDELAQCGYSADELHRRIAHGRTPRGGRWGEVQAAERAYTEATRGLDAHAGAVRGAIDAWWQGHASTVEALCYRHADMLLATRRAAL